MSSTQTSVDHIDQLLQQCLQHWSVRGLTVRHVQSGYRLFGGDVDIAVERCPDSLPFRWSVRTPERTRTASSISGVLRHVRQILGIEAQPLSMNFAQPVGSHTVKSSKPLNGGKSGTTNNATVDAQGNRSKIPVTVLTGYLGSGKTTLLAELLTHPTFSRTAIIVNEFGEIGIDHDLIETSDESTVQLTTGCLCCLAQDELGQTLADLIRRRDDGEVTPFDRVVIETSGLADPVPIVQSLLRHPAVTPRFVFERVVTTVDVLTAAGVVDKEPEFTSQVALADRIILTKTDVAGPASTQLLKKLRRINHDAEFTDRWQDGHLVEQIVHGEKQVLSVDANDDVVERWVASNADNTHHATAVQAVCLVRDTPLAAVALTLFLEALAEHFGLELLRLKGLIHVRENPSQPYLIQGVQHVFHAPLWRERWPGGERRTRLVLLGRNLSEPLIERLLESIAEEVDAVQNAAQTEGVAMPSSLDVCGAKH